ncbi:MULTISPECIES: hypothetical protein [unclassified Sphingomonas]|jgi:hypothetical protein|uniref:hypothetical protein n=1 Tax=unclassified Sphingomonas TaxID=196159 RepID=UPI000E10C686|nr:MULTISPECIES: hypothetical protein [unclassified Sphingomonas]AXJ95634.1 hypothetical protein DM480_09030 [Sphingomonas sp. FARSPH]
MAKKMRTWTAAENAFNNFRSGVQREMTDRVIIAGLEATKAGGDVAGAMAAETEACDAEWPRRAAAWDAERRAARADAADPAATAAPASAADAATAAAGDAAEDADDTALRAEIDRLLTPSRLRVAGWSVKTQRAFIVALAETGCVSHAAQAVGRSRQSAYALRNRAPRAIFAIAWDVAIEQGKKRLYDLALEQAIEGREVPVWYRGEQVGTRRVFNDRLTAFLIAHKRGPAHPAMSDYEASAMLPQMLGALGMVLPDPLAVRIATEKAIARESARDPAQDRPGGRWGKLYPQEEDELFPKLDS